MIKENQLLKDVKDSTKLGIVSMTGLGVTGLMSNNIPGTAGVQNSVTAGINLANVGQTAKVGLDLAKMFK